jgi:hypothetical protein
MCSGIFTTESTEFAETDGKERRVRIRIRNPFLPASVPSVLSVVRLWIPPATVQSPCAASGYTSSRSGRDIFCKCPWPLAKSRN